MQRVEPKNQYDGFSVVMARTQKRVKAIALATAIGIHPTTLSRMENGWLAIPDEVAQAIAAELDIPVESLRTKDEGAA